MKLHRTLLLLTIAIGALTLFWGLGSIPLLSFNEARRAIPASNIFTTGDWLLPTLNGELYLTKPPLLYWMGAISAHLFGAANEWAVRLPSAIAAVTIAIVTYRLSLRQFGPWPALFSVQILIASSGFTTYARRVQLETLQMALCFCALMAMLQYTRDGGRRPWIWLSYFLLGAAILTKGPIALLFVTLPLLVNALYQRQPRQWQALRDPLGWAICLAVGSSWFLAVTWQMGPDIWKAIFQKDIVSKVSSPERDPIYMYFVWLLTDFFPWSLLIFVAPIAAWRRWKENRTTVTLSLAVIVPLLLYSAFSSKNAKYLLPIYPFIAILLGKRLGEIFEGAGALTRKSLLAITLLLPAGYAAFYAFAEPRILNYRYAAFPQISAWVGQIKDTPLYGYIDLDERLIYYAKRNVPILTEASLQEMRANKTSLLLMVEGSKSEEMNAKADCRVTQFSPYLSKNKTLTVYGFGSACSSATQQK